MFPLFSNVTNYISLWNCLILCLNKKNVSKLLFQLLKYTIEKENTKRVLAHWKFHSAIANTWYETEAEAKQKKKILTRKILLNLGEWKELYYSGSPNILNLGRCSVLCRRQIHFCFCCCCIFYTTNGSTMLVKVVRL